MSVPSGRSLNYKPLILAFLLAPLVWAVLYWVIKLPPGTLLTGLQQRIAGSAQGAPALLSNSRLWLWLLQAVIVYPVLEEIVFRGALQGWLLQRRALQWPRLQRFSAGLISLPNLLTSIVFAALHLISQPPLWAALVFFPSLIFGWSREYTGGLTIPILLHSWYNAGFYLLFVQL